MIMEWSNIVKSIGVIHLSADAEGVRGGGVWQKCHLHFEKLLFNQKGENLTQKGGKERNKQISTTKKKKNMERNHDILLIKCFFRFWNLDRKFLLWKFFQRVFENLQFEKKIEGV